MLTASQSRQYKKNHFIIKMENAMHGLSKPNLKNIVECI